jgi:toxin ParE1/3/4
MSLCILITPKASQDLDDLFKYIAQNNFDAANRFFDATRQTIASLAKTPGIGSLYLSNNSRLLGLRRWGLGVMRNI